MFSGGAPYTAQPPPTPSPLQMPSIPTPLPPNVGDATAERRFSGALLPDGGLGTPTDLSPRPTAYFSSCRSSAGPSATYPLPQSADASDAVAAPANDILRGMQEALQSLAPSAAAAPDVRSAVEHYTAVIRAAVTADRLVSEGESYFTHVASTHQALMQFYNKAVELSVSARDNSAAPTPRPSGTASPGSASAATPAAAKSSFAQLSQDVQDAQRLSVAVRRFEHTLTALDLTHRTLLSDYVLDTTPQRDKVCSFFSTIPPLQFQLPAAPLAGASSAAGTGAGAGAAERYTLEHLATLQQRMIGQLTDRRLRTQTLLWAELAEQGIHRDGGGSGGDTPEARALFTMVVRGAAPDGGDARLATTAARFALSQLLEVTLDFVESIERGMRPLLERRSAALAEKEKELALVDRYDPRRAPLQETFFEVQREVAELSETAGTLAALRQQLHGTREQTERAVVSNAETREQVERALQRRSGGGALAAARLSASGDTLLSPTASQRPTQSPTSAVGSSDLVATMAAIARQKEQQQSGATGAAQAPPSPASGRASAAETAPRGSTSVADRFSALHRLQDDQQQQQQKDSVSPSLRRSRAEMEGPAGQPRASATGASPSHTPLEAPSGGRQDDSDSDSGADKEFQEAPPMDVDPQAERDTARRGRREYSLRRGSLLRGIGALLMAVARRAFTFDDDGGDDSDSDSESNFSGSDASGLSPPHKRRRL